MPGPRLEAEGGADIAPGEAAGEVPRERDALWLVLGTLPEGPRRALLDDVAAQVTAAEAKANPLLVNFLDEPPPESFFKTRPWLGPALNAARALTCERWRVPGGGGLVRAVAEPAAPPGEGSLAAPLGGASLAAWTPGSRDIERLRSAAWPASLGLLVRFATGDDARRGAAALGERLASGESTIGALLLGPGAASAPEAVPFRLSARASRARGELIEIARHLVEGPPAGPPCAWLAPLAGEAYVVPRLGALARLAEFVDETRRTLRDRGAAAHYYDGRQGNFERA